MFIGNLVTQKPILDFIYCYFLKIKFYCFAPSVLLVWWHGNNIQSYVGTAVYIIILTITIEIFFIISAIISNKETKLTCL